MPEESKTCTKCRHLKRVPDDFYMRRDRGGVPRLSTWCRECNREYKKGLEPGYRKRRQQDPTVCERDTAYNRMYQREYRSVEEHRTSIRVNSRLWAKSRRARIDILKDYPCVDCGRKLPSCCMDFDHVHGEKVHNVSRMFSFSEKRLLEEVAKCEVVCACCHRVRTTSRRVRKAGSRHACFFEKLDVLRAPPCLDCGETFPPVAMDFDHVRGIKLKNVSAMSTHLWSRVLEEVSKCDLVCACCHRIRTQSRKTSKGRHRKTTSQTPVESAHV